MMPDKRLILDAEIKAAKIKQSRQVHRDLIKELIKEDDFYEETVPFPDYSSASEDDEEDPHADMKGKALNLNNYAAFKNQRDKKKRIAPSEVFARERAHTEPKEMKSFKYIDKEIRSINRNKKKVVDANGDRSNKLFWAND